MVMTYLTRHLMNPTYIIWRDYLYDVRNREVVSRKVYAKINFRRKVYLRRKSTFVEQCIRRLRRNLGRNNYFDEICL